MAVCSYRCCYVSPHACLAKSEDGPITGIATVDSTQVMEPALKGLVGTCYSCIHSHCLHELLESFCNVLNSIGLARIRVQLSSEHTKEQVDKCVDAFISIGKRKQVIP